MVGRPYCHLFCLTRRPHDHTVILNPGFGVSRKTRSAHVASLSLPPPPHPSPPHVSCPPHSISRPTRPSPMPAASPVCPCPHVAYPSQSSPRPPRLHFPPVSPLPDVSLYCLHVTTRVSIFVSGLSHTIALRSDIHTGCVSTRYTYIPHDHGFCVTCHHLTDDTGNLYNLL